MHINSNSYTKFKNLIIKIQTILVCGLIGFSAFGQDVQEIQIANEYILKGQKDKALSLYEQLAKKK